MTEYLSFERPHYRTRFFGKNLHALVEEKADLPGIVDMFRDIDASGRLLNVYVNNHYEGSAPLTIDKIRALLD